MQPPKTYYAQDIEIWSRAHQNRDVTRYQISRLVGKVYLKSATVVIAANKFRKTGFFPASVTYLMYMILEVSQFNITSCLLDNPVPCTITAEEPPTTSDTNPQTITNSHSA